MAGMTKRQARKAEKDEPFRESYQAYLKMMKSGGRSSFKQSKTQAEWRKLTPHTKNIIMQRGPK